MFGFQWAGKILIFKLVRKGRNVMLDATKENSAVIMLT